MDIAEICRILGDETRLRILNLISKRELCVCLIKEVLGLLQPNASKHIGRLKDAGVIECRKISQWCFFSVSKGFISNHRAYYAALQEEWNRGPQYVQDAAKLEYLIKTNDCCRELLEKSGMSQKTMRMDAGLRLTLL
jgi:ArsR family transcriptional regulator, arsenate/arsenite/antimonite-responsive transcriptional repressor